jgi:hypothetical protein
MERDATERGPTLPRVIARAIEAGLVELRVAIPARVVGYDATKQRVDVQPLIQRVTLDEEDARHVETDPVVPGVPLMFPGGAGYRITFPISDGHLVVDGATLPATTGTLFFADASLDRWLSGGGGIVDPEIDHAHALTDGIFVPGLRPFGAALASCPTDHATAGADAGVQIHFRGSTITIGDEAGSDFVALAQKVLDELNAIKAAFSGHLHAPGSYTTPSGAVTGTSAPGPMYNPSSVAASQAKGK